MYVFVCACVKSTNKATQLLHDSIINTTHLRQYLRVQKSLRNSHPINDPGLYLNTLSHPRPRTKFFDNISQVAPGPGAKKINQLLRTKAVRGDLHFCQGSIDNLNLLLFDF